MAETQFLERLKLGFGTSESLARQQQIETGLGLKGKFDIGDIADVAGGSLPFIGALLGGAGGTIGGFGVGGVPGAAIGAGAGEAVKGAIGQVLGVRKEATATGEALRPLVTGVATLVGGKVVGKVGEKVFKPALEKLGKVLPERLMSQIFNRSKDDFAKLLRTESFAELQKTKPDLFNKYVQQGIVRIGKNQKVEINPSLAQEVLDRGLFGSSEGMTKYGFVKQLQLESEIRNTLKGMKQRIPLPERSSYIKLLTNLKGEFSKQGQGFFSDRVKEANKFISKLTAAKNKQIDPMDVLELRRFLDGMRNTGSFRLNPNLSSKQESYKKAADILRSKLAKIPEISKNMNEYRIWIEAVDSLVNHAVKTGNRRLLNLTDIIVGGGGLAGGFPGTGVGAATLIRLFQTPAFLTSAAQAFSKLGQARLPQPLQTGLGFELGRGIKGGIGGILNK